MFQHLMYEERKHRIRIQYQDLKKALTCKGDTRHRPTDNASTRRWRSSQETGPANNDTFITSLATLSLSRPNNK